MEHIKISNYKELAEYKTRLKDKKWLSSVQFDISKAEMPVIKIVGKYHHSSLDCNSMQAFCILQDEIYRRFAEYKYGKADKRRLTTAEKEALEIFIEVSEGSTLIKVILPKLVPLGMNLLADVTQNDIFRNTGLIIATEVFVEYLCDLIDKGIEDKKTKSSQKLKRVKMKVKFGKFLSLEKESLEIDGHEISSSDIRKILQS